MPDFEQIAQGHLDNPIALALRLAHVMTENPIGAAEALAHMIIESKKHPLTGLFNKAHFLHQLGHKDRRHNKEDYLLMIDLDGFKAINDTYGHNAGDKVLKKVAERLHANSRATDVVAHLSGDEFAFILCGADQKSAERKKNKIQAELDEGIPVQWKNVTILQRGSVGVCKIDPSKSALENLDIGDKMMFEMKRSKGNTRNQPVLLAL